ncbi:DUF4097 family beta strand repeat-containing protein [Dokdonella koreensis]|uniref:DUF4097 domain-containing protein n=1 Tax=Dokdonella koreensis DS-123 TaxID=1300342 RepID=A0A167H0B0_9GAMM|nr:DUF4097 family beta strand repeat-containing protein [Dokdonella koreensis]ANB18352.1 Hypothetical protein I596_2344 [Dokdonella koreensis DS-123]
MKTPVLSLLVPTALVLLAAAAHAAQPIDQTRAVDADARIEISNIKGSVTVVGWDRDEVAISGSLGDGSKGLTVEGSGSRLTVRVEPPEKSGWFSWGADSRMGETTLRLSVPRRAELDIDVVSANVDVDGVGGRRLAVESVSGKLRLTTSATDCELSTVSGSIEINGCSRSLDVESVSGNVRGRGAGGDLGFETVSGNVDVEAGRYRKLTAGTVSGGITIRGGIEPDARVEIESMSGEVSLQVGADVSADLHAETFSGNIRSDFGTVVSEERGPGRHLQTRIGGGAARIRIETFSGSIRIVSR